MQRAVEIKKVLNERMNKLNRNIKFLSYLIEEAKKSGHVKTAKITEKQLNLNIARKKDLENVIFI